MERPPRGDSPRPGTETLTPARPEARLQPPYHVILLDDNDHSYEYVVEMLCRVFGHSAQRAYLHAVEVDSAGRSVVDTTTLERAELKRDQIHAYGPDPRIPRCCGSMSAILEASAG